MALTIEQQGAKLSVLYYSYGVHLTETAKALLCNI